jgi:glycosyltransferase involved in cell wall biosynthesis
MPVGPEFAPPDQFRPLGIGKDYDLIYVAAAQQYKSSIFLFDALERLPRDIRVLCVFGYGEMADHLRRRAAETRLNVDFVGPPGVPYEEVNQLMNRARFGVACGVEDGAPVPTEYMLAGLPVLANEALCCGLQFMIPETGITAPAERFANAITCSIHVRRSWRDGHGRAPPTGSVGLLGPILFQKQHPSSATAVPV